ncbi:MAG: hypothetical protein U0894_08105 [Pirellulales bacterium]
MMALPKGESRLSIYRVSYCSWSEQMKRAPRDPDSVLLANGLMESLVEDVRQFLTRREWYSERGVPYRRGCRCMARLGRKEFGGGGDCLGTEDGYCHAEPQQRDAG